MHVTMTKILAFLLPFASPLPSLAAEVMAQTPRAGSISGTISYPSEWIPPLRIYALTEGGRAHFAVTTTENQNRFTIQGIPAGKYFVVAYPISKADAPLEAGAWTQFVQCGMTTQCHDHSLIPVAVTAGKTATGVKVEDWDAPPGTFPPEPISDLQHAAVSADCGKAGSRLEEDSCNVKAYEVADKALNKEYQRVMTTLESQGLPACKERLRAAQRAWIKFRDEHCHYEGTTGYTGRWAVCMKEATELRTDYLKQQSPDWCH